MAIETTKHSFTELLAAQSAAKHNSDLKNLATAVTQIDVEILELQKLRVEILNTATKIESGQVVDVSEIKRLFNAARGNRVTL